jgi:hypothetical protein
MNIYNYKTKYVEGKTVNLKFLIFHVINLEIKLQKVKMKFMSLSNEIQNNI